MNEAQKLAQTFVYNIRRKMADRKIKLVHLKELVINEDEHAHKNEQRSIYGFIYNGELGIDVGTHIEWALDGPSCEDVIVECRKQIKEALKLVDIFASPEAMADIINCNKHIDI